MTSIRTFVAGDLPEATRRAAAELGRDAIILKIQYVQPKGLWKMAGRQRVELQACAPSDLGVPRRRLAPEPARERVSARAGGG